jgi:hypothetical protein
LFVQFPLREALTALIGEFTRDDVSRDLLITHHAGLAEYTFDAGLRIVPDADSAF